MTRLFDAYAGFGGNKPGLRETVFADDWSREMERLCIHRALVRTAPEELDADWSFSNESLLKSCEDHPNMIPCPVVIPGTGQEPDGDPQQVSRLLDRGAGVVCIRPKHDLWMLEEWACGPLWRAIQDRRAPVFCKEDQVCIKDVADLAGRYPHLPIILAATGYRWQRVVMPLMRAFRNVHFCLGGAYSLHRGLEQLVEKLGPERILFGTGFPETEPMTAVTLLMYADVTDQQRALIGAGNLERLVGGIRR